MAIKIYHGPHGSYKTASAVMDLLPVAREGRVIVTNVRGMTAERFHELIDDLPSSFDVINVNRETKEGIHKIKTFWHWVPNGAFMLWDEAQRCFPKSLKQAELDSLAYKTPEEAHADGRAHEWDDAWDMERHNNYDMILTTPNIKKIRDDIRENAEMAIKHKNQALMGMFFKGECLQGWHSADKSGLNVSDFYQSPTRKFNDKSECWQLYDSTKTGEVKDTTAGFNLFKSPKIIIGVVVILLAAAFLFRKGKPDILPKTTNKAPTAAVQNHKEVANQSMGEEGSIIIPEGFIQDHNIAASPLPVIEVLKPIDLVNKARTQDMLKGCISTLTSCTCYNNNGVKLNLSDTYCYLIVDSGFYKEPYKPQPIEQPMQQIATNRNQQATSISAKSIDELYAQQADKLDIYEEITASREGREPIKGTMNLPAT